MTSDGSDAAVRAELALADECLGAAANDRTGGFHRRAVSSAYYAAFHAARAVLAKLGLEAKSHAGVRELFAQHLVLPGKFPIADGRLLRRMQKDREDADYALYSMFDITDADAGIAAATDFVTRARVFTQS